MPNRADWYNYDLPEHLIGKSWKGKYRGQTQKWFALRFLGEESEINLAPPGHKQEFDQWRWARMDEVLDLIVPFKRGVYEQVIADFRHLGRLIRLSCWICIDKCSRCTSPTCCDLVIIDFGIFVCCELSFVTAAHALSNFLNLRSA